MPTAEILRERRDRARQRQEHVEKLLRDGKLTLVGLGEELVAEREEREHLQSRREALRAALEAEIERDAEGKGKKGKAWEAWAGGRRDELADLIEASENRADRLIIATADTRAKRKELAKRDRQLEQRIEAIEKRLQRKAQASGQLTASFHVAEFDCRDGTPVPTGSIPALKRLCVEHLQPLRDSGGLVSINSGYRTRSYNASIGGAQFSEHIYDEHPNSCAADHIQSGRGASSVADWHEAHNPPDGLGRYASFTHIDNRGYHARWTG